jgi:hypothetical protein
VKLCHHLRPPPLDLPQLLPVISTHTHLHFSNQLSKLTAKGGDDECEDVLGALSEMCSMGWTSRARFCVLVCDAPGHGNDLHLPGVGDRFPEGVPGRSVQSVMGDIRSKGIELLVCHLRPSATLKMDAALRSAHDAIEVCESQYDTTGALPSCSLPTALYQCARPPVGICPIILQSQWFYGSPSQLQRPMQPLLLKIGTSHVLRTVWVVMALCASRSMVCARRC